MKPSPDFAAPIRSMMFFLLALLVVCTGRLAWRVYAASAPGYHILNTYKLGGEGGWDYLLADGDTHRLYISRATHVIVLDTSSLSKPTADIPDTPGVHGIALAPEFGKGFISNGREGTVSIFDLKTYKTTSKVKAGENPDAIIYDPSSKRVFAFNGRSHDATAIDAEKGAAVGSVQVGGKPEFAVSDGKGGVFVNIEDKNEILSLDPDKLTVKAHWPLSPCESPSGLAMDRKNRRLFAGCDNKMMAVVDADSGKVITTLPIGDGVDATAFDPGTNLAFASCGEGVLNVIHEDSPDKFTVVENVKTKRGARTMALDESTHKVYTVTADFGPPPAPTPQQPHPRPSILPDTFVVLELGK
jgi:DNA-binding beta-propeller fold protein YncE